MATRRQLPLPDNVAPSRRAPPPVPTYDDAPPPPLPSRPTPGRAAAPPPAAPTSRIPPKPPMARRNHKPTDDGDDYEFDSDSSAESYEDMSGQEKPPSLPKRGYKEQKTAPPPTPAKFKSPSPPQDTYDDGTPGEIYDDAEFDEQGSEGEQETYDDMEVATDDIQQEVYAECADEPIPSRSKPQPQQEFVQENYDEFGGVAEDMYEVEDVQEDTQEEYQECEIGAPIAEDVYQVADDESPSPVPAAPALPPPRPKQSRDVAAPPPPRKTEEKKPAVKAPGGMPAIAMGDIQNIKNQLKRVSVSPKEPVEKKEPKMYTDHNELKSKFDFFKQKEKEALNQRPGIAPKPLVIKKSTSVDSPKGDKITSPSPGLPNRKLSDSLPPVPKNDLPPPPPTVNEAPSHTRDLPPPPPVNGMPDLPPPRGRDGYTKVSVNEVEENHDDDQEVYDDASSFVDPLLMEKWYFGKIEREVGNAKLKKQGSNGTYLLRESTKGGNQPFTLMVMYNSHIYNLKIRERDDGRVALGEEKPDEMSFVSVIDLIKHHQSNDVILVHRDGKQETTKLIHAPPK